MGFDPNDLRVELDSILEVGQFSDGAALWAMP
jgi:hypothetical protein